jgi:hypothetical protein
MEEHHAQPLAAAYHQNILIRAGYSAYVVFYLLKLFDYE